MKVGVIGAGSFEPTPYILEELGKCDYTIAVDGGLHHFIAMGISPDEVIGDFDSMSEHAKKWMKEKAIAYTRYPTEKDKTDSSIALTRAVECGASEILMLGYTGSRLDHSLANILMLDRLRKSDAKGKIVDANNVIMLIDNFIDIRRDDFSDYKYVSVIPLSDQVTLDMIGFKYEVKELSMEFGANEGRGISNEILSDFAHIRLHGQSGRILLILSRD